VAVHHLVLIIEEIFAGGTQAQRPNIDSHLRHLPLTPYCFEGPCTDTWSVICSTDQ
jgi:hypothetical protein